MSLPRSIAILLLIFCVPCGTVMAAGGSLAAGEQKATVCQSCHGPTGADSVTPDIPVLAGQHADYLAHALRAYRSGKRQQAVMATFAQQLSDQDIEDLAAWFAAQEGPLHTAASGD